MKRTSKTIRALPGGFILLLVFPLVLLLGLAEGVEAASRMYWTDASTGKIQQANLDGSGVEDLLTGLVDFSVDGREAAAVDAKLEDVDKDGNLDMSLHFNIQDTGIQCGDTLARLTGETIYGQVIQGSDSIVTTCK
jgi:hypothetical protein